MTEPSTDLHDKKEHEAKHAPHPVHESLEHSQKELVKEAIRDETAREKIDAKKEAKEKEVENKAEAAKKIEAKPELKVEKTEKKAETSKEKVTAKKDDKVEKKVEYVLQRKVVIPLSDSYAKPAKKRAARAIKLIRAYAARHTKSLESSVKISEKVAGFVNARGSKYPPKKLKVSLLKDKQGNVTVVPA